MDAKIPVALKMFERRKKGYAAIGYQIETGEDQVGTSTDTPELPLMP